jgi:hypothetical protein
MQGSRSWTMVLMFLVLGGILGSVRPAAAVDDGETFSGNVNCGDSNTNNACIECCSGQPGCTIGKISCCPLTGDCTVTNKPTGGTVLNLKLSAGGLALQLTRKETSDGYDVKLKSTFLKKVFLKGVKIKASLAGGDAKLAALLFPVLFLANGDAAFAQLGGYDVAVTGTLPTCQSLYPNQLCSEIATSLSRAIYGALTAGDRVEAAQFLEAINSFGQGPCQTFG